jgi:hypothetical protein
MSAPQAQAPPAPARRLTRATGSASHARIAGRARSQRGPTERSSRNMLTLYLKHMGWVRRAGIVPSPACSSIYPRAALLSIGTRMEMLVGALPRRLPPNSEWTRFPVPFYAHPNRGAWHLFIHECIPCAS